MNMFIGMDIGGTKFLVASADRDGNIIEKVTEKTPLDLEEGLELLKKMARTVADNEINVIGASVGGPLNWKEGIVSPLHQPRWRDVSLKKIMEREFGCSFFVDVDTNVAVLGEWFARNQAPKRLLYLTISTGMGGGFMIDGKIYRGMQDEHQEVAHQSVKWKGDYEHVVCECGAHNCLEELVSGNGIRRLYGKPPEQLTDKEWAEVGYNLGQGLRNMAALYAPDVIAIGGGLALGAGEKLLGPARKIMEQELRIVPIPRVELSVLGYETPLVGCIALAKMGKELGY